VVASAVRPSSTPASRTAASGRARNNFFTDPEDLSQEWRRLLAEFFGTFALTLVAAGGAVFAATGAGGNGKAAQVVAPALLVMAMIYTVGDVSGAHFNPAVTLAFTLRGDFPWTRVPGYWAAQIAGAIVAAAVLRAMFGTIGHLGATMPNAGDTRAVIVEALLTLLLITVIIGTAAGHKLVGHNAALASGGVIALDGLFASPISGASMNPARSLGPDLVGGMMSTYWVYLLGPLIGALAAVGLATALDGRASRNERQAAIGS
jgi:aquaporin Z